MDNIDTALISLLRQNARIGVSEIASQLRISRGTVKNRIARLERDKVIQGYTITLGNPDRPIFLVAWTCIIVEGNQTRSVAKALLGLPEVKAVHDTNGKWDLLAELQASDTVRLSQVLEELRTLKGVKHSETSIHLATFR